MHCATCEPAPEYQQEKKPFVVIYHPLVHHILTSVLDENLLPERRLGEQMKVTWAKLRNKVEAVVQNAVFLKWLWSHVLYEDKHCFGVMSSSAANHTVWSIWLALNGVSTGHCR